MPSAGIEPLFVYVYLSLVNQPPLSLWTSNPYSTARFFCEAICVWTRVYAALFDHTEIVAQWNEWIAIVC